MKNKRKTIEEKRFAEVIEAIKVIKVIEVNGKENDPLKWELGDV